MKKFLGIVVLGLLWSTPLIATPPKNKWSPSLERWKKDFPKAEYPPNDCKFCTERHDYWAHGYYRKASLKNRDHKNNVEFDKTLQTSKNIGKHRLQPKL